jgi:hypothetical protein
LARALSSNAHGASSPGASRCTICPTEYPRVVVIADTDDTDDTDVNDATCMRSPLAVIGLDEDARADEDAASTARATARLAPRRASVANIVIRSRLNKKTGPGPCRSNATANEWRRSGAIDRSRKTRSENSRSQTRG